MDFVHLNYKLHFFSEQRETKKSTAMFTNGYVVLYLGSKTTVVLFAKC